MNDFPRFFVHGVSAEAWVRRYGMTPFTHPCYHCARPLTTTIPFVQGSLRGLQAPTCACGYTQTPYVIMRDPKYGDLLDGMEPTTAPRRRPRRRAAARKPRTHAND